MNALVEGFDPTYYGLTYDDGAVTRGGFHLSIEGDRLLRGTALEELRATPVPLVLEMWARKALAFVFVTAQEWNVALLRSSRVVMVVLGLAAILWQRRSRMVMALALFAGYLVAVHAPLFYLHRYSVALDPVLALLAAIGLAEAAASPARLAKCAVACVLAVGIALVPLAQVGPRAAAPREVAVRSGVDPRPDLLPGNARRRARDPGHRRAARQSRGAAGAHHAGGDHARAARRLQGAAIPLQGIRRQGLRPGARGEDPVRADGRRREITLGAYAPLRLNQEGMLRIEFECDSAAAAEIAQ